jgi:hypothetical protein
LPSGLARELLPRPEHVTAAMDAKARHVTMAWRTIPRAVAKSALLACQAFIGLGTYFIWIFEDSSQSASLYNDITQVSTHTKT